MSHVDELLARGLEEGLSHDEEARVREHLRSCAQCSALEADLRANDLRLATPQARIDLPHLAVDTAAPPYRRNPWSVAGVTAAVAALLVVVIIASVQPRAPTSGSPSRERSGDAGPHLLLAHRAVLDTVPGGGSVVTEAFDSFRILSTDGAAADAAISGVAIGRPAFDGQGRLAYWGRTSLTSGAYRLTIWDANTQQERTILTLADERPAGEVLWTADGRALIALTQTASGDRFRMIRIDAIAPAPVSNVLSETTAEGQITPLYADEAIVVGVSARSYVVLDGRTGQTVREVPLRSPRAGQFTASRSGFALELVRTFEAEAGPLRIWRVTDPSTTIASVEELGISTPLVWPGRAEVVYVRGNQIYAMDLASGAKRVLASLPETPVLIGFSPAGDELVVRVGNAFRAFAVAGDQLQSRPNSIPVVDPSLFEPVGVGR
jgi:hypothetical protein